jgi:alpha-D-xyloside xylohydrolase
VVDRASGRVRFCDASGKQFLSEKPGTRVLEPKAVQGEPSFAVGQGFELAPGEHLFGLGQFQDGLWDWRGLPLELRQLNTQISVPVLISSEGYGLLWDNASRTDFNLPGEPVALVAENPSTDAAANGPTATEQLAANSKAKKQAAIWKGTFTSGDAGEYAFCTRDGDRREEIAILVDGWQIAGVKNMWVPRAAIGKISLPAHETCEVTVRGGGEKVKLFAGPVTGSTTFRSGCVARRLTTWCFTG